MNGVRAAAGKTLVEDLHQLTSVGLQETSLPRAGYEAWEANCKGYYIMRSVEKDIVVQLSF